MDRQGRYLGLGTVLGQEHHFIHLDVQPVHDLLVDVVGEQMLLPDGDQSCVADAFDEASFILSPDRKIPFLEQPVPYVDAGRVLQAGILKASWETANVPPRIIFLIFTPEVCL